MQSWQKLIWYQVAYISMIAADALASKGHQVISKNDAESKITFYV